MLTDSKLTHFKYKDDDFLMESTENFLQNRETDVLAQTQTQKVNPLDLFFSSIMNNKKQILIQLLYSFNIKNVYHQTVEGVTPLELAIKHDNFVIVRILLQSGFDIEMPENCSKRLMKFLKHFKKNQSKQLCLHENISKITRKSILSISMPQKITTQYIKRIPSKSTPKFIKKRIKFLKRKREETKLTFEKSNFMTFEKSNKKLKLTRSKFLSKKEMKEILQRKNIEDINTQLNNLNIECELSGIKSRTECELSGLSELSELSGLSISSKPVVDYVGSTTSYKLSGKTKPKSILKSKRLQKSKRRMNKILNRCDKKMKELKL